MMDQSGEDWLNDEKFDFDLNISKSSVEEEEEVFFGPMSHKEKCVAALLQEKEIKSAQTPNPQEQALLLRETALIAVRIKSQHNPTASPVAVVHPMKREDITNEWVSEENKENIPRNKTEVGCTNEIPPSQSLKGINQLPTMPINPSGNKTGFIEPYSDSQCLKGNYEEDSESVQMNKTEIHANIQIPQNELPKQPNICTAENPIKLRKSTHPKNRFASNRLSMPTKLPGGVTELMEPHPSEGHNTSVTKATKQFKKTLMPKPGSISKSKSGAGIPSLLPSVLPSRPKQNGRTSSIKPLKPQSQSYSGISQSEEKSSTKVYGVGVPHLKMSGRKCVSAGTPPANIKMSVTSAHKQSLGGRKYSTSIDTPNNGKKVPNKLPKSETRPNLITPVVKSSRKSIIGRKLNPASDDDRLKQPDNSDTQTNESVDSVNVAPVEKLRILSTDDILEKYRNICNSQKQSIPPKKEETVSTINSNENICSNPSSDEKFKQDEIIQHNITDESMPCGVNIENDDLEMANGNESLATIQMSTTSSNNTVNPNDFLITNSVESKEINLLTISSPAPMLIDIDCLESEISPVRLNNKDPFETGNTPPPLIELDVVLQPERPPELNLIEF